MLYQAFLGMMFLFSTLFIYLLYVHIQKFKSVSSDVSELAQFKAQMIIQSNQYRIIGMCFITISLIILFIGNLSTDRFNLINMYPAYNFSNAKYTTTVILATGLCMLLNNFKIQKLMNSGKDATGAKLAVLKSQVAPKERVHNLFFVLFSFALALQFLVYGFSFL